MTQEHRHSQEQQDAEAIVLDQLAQQLSQEGQPVQFGPNPTDWGIQLDGYCASPLIFVEVWARVGKAKPAQRHKVMNDFCKLMLAEKMAEAPARKILAVVCDDAVQFLKGSSWQQKFATEHGIEIHTVVVPDAIKDGILKAQDRQGWPETTSVS